MNSYRNLNYGFCTTTNETYVVVGNPSPFNYPAIATGSVEVLKYNSEVDKYVPHALIKKTIDPDAVYLNTEVGNRLNTETSLPFILDASAGIGYYIADKYGTSISLYSDLLAVGNTAHYYQISSGSSTVSGSGVDIYDLSNVTSPYYPAYYITNSVEVPYVSYGKSVALHGNYLAVGSDLTNNESGRVYIYQLTQSSWRHIQTISGSQSTTGSRFGGVVKFDASGSYNLIVGNSASGSGKVYLYSFNTGSNQWTQAKIFSADRSIAQQLSFISLSPYITSSSNPDGYGNSVGIYGDTIVIGAPTDTQYTEYTGSTSPHYRGAAYIYARCSGDNTLWNYTTKTFGNEITSKTNKFGMSVDVYGSASIIGDTKYETPYSASYITNTLFKKYNDNPDDDRINRLGNLYVLVRDDNGNWNYTATVSKKKEYGFPFSVYGASAAIYNSTIVVGSPVTLNNPSAITASSYEVTGSSYIYNLNDIESDYQVGNVFYKNGIFCFSNGNTIFDSLLKSRGPSPEVKYDLTYASKLTIFEKHIICTIDPGEFNTSTNPTAVVRSNFVYDIDGDANYTFTDADLILRFINKKLYDNQDWSGSLDLSSDEDVSLYSYYNTLEDQVTGDKLIPYSASLEAAYLSFDVDGNKKINLNDMKMIWEYFKYSTVPTTVFPYIDPKSARKTSTDINRYIETMTGKNVISTVNPTFYSSSYSSSIDVTGSYLSPVFTTIGLYSGAELIGVAKLATPLKLNNKIPLNISIKLDM